MTIFYGGDFFKVLGIREICHDDGNCLGIIGSTQVYEYRIIYIYIYTNMYTEVCACMYKFRFVCYHSFLSSPFSVLIPVIN